MAKKNPYLNDRDILDQALEHSWGKTADAKAKEKAYNREYYQRHKEEILRKARQAGEGIQRTAQNAYDYGRKLANDAKTSQNMRGHVQKERFVDAAGRMGSKFLRKSADYFKTHGDNEHYNEAMRTARDYSRLRTDSAQAINEADKLARQNSPVERVKRDLRRTTAGARANVENTINDVKTAFSNERRQASNPMDRNTIRPYERAHEMNDRLYKEAKNRSSNAENRVQESNARAERFRNASAADPSRATEYQKMAREAGQETYKRIGESNRAAKNQRRMANRRAASGAAYNEASKAAQRDDWGVYDKRFDSKLARNAQNTYSKARGTAKKAKDSVDQFVNNALSKTKKKKKS